MLREYLKPLINSYIAFQVQSYELGAITKSLQGHGIRHEDTILHRGRGAKKFSEELDKQTYYYLKGVLADYVKERLDEGIHENQVARELYEYGIKTDMINDIIKFVVPPKVELKIPHGILYISSFIWVFSIIFFLGYTLEVEIGVVLAAFVPTFVTIIVAFITIAKTHSPKLRYGVPFLSIVLVALLFLIIVPRLTQSNLELPVLLVINVGLTFMASLFVTLFYKTIRTGY